MQLGKIGVVTVEEALLPSSTSERNQTGAYQINVLIIGLCTAETMHAHKPYKGTREPLTLLYLS